MSMPEDHIRAQTVEVVTAYISKNILPAADVGAFIRETYAALTTLCQPTPEAAPALTPAVPIKKSVFPDKLISLEDGKPYKSLRRHLTSHGLTPETYREKWGLSPDYPMVCKTYSEVRSGLAKAAGLGNKSAAAKGTPAAASAGNTTRKGARNGADRAAA